VGEKREIINSSSGGGVKKGFCPTIKGGGLEKKG
jgi:hypothetical protein